ncbi:hypothetical protein EYF80_012475 [Liparis tanakae]|uniref:Uncharacterized protein n=1 Tax=Liparis tanakae TaxID=230148 RepID=A0A4Z2II05_9TELE|nr:hypothetical protein EYF80_012475 [Liparis tanakae]
MAVGCNAIASLSDAEQTPSFKVQSACLPLGHHTMNPRGVFPSPSDCVAEPSVTRATVSSPPLTRSNVLRRTAACCLFVSSCPWAIYRPAVSRDT